MDKGVLIVEGNADVFFFDALLREWQIRGVKVSPPASVNRVNGKFHAIETLSIYVKQLLDASIEGLAIVLDADTPLVDQMRGLDPTLQAVDQKMNEAGFSRSSIVGRGYVYAPRSGASRARVFLWVMPDCRSDGSLEDFVRQQVDPKTLQASWYAKAKAAVDELNEPLFDRAAHSLKATTSTWLAWQRYPGKGMQSVVGDHLIDLDNGNASLLKSWLKAAFP
jgi:hypothetical protein